MKLNIAYPSTGAQKAIEIDDEKKLRQFYDKSISQEVAADFLGDEWKGYVLRINGGNDKQGFPMMQGVLTNTRVRLLLRAGHKCYRPRRDGERKRKSVRGCIVGADISALHLVVVKKGAAEIPGLTDRNIPNRLGPKRASKIRRLFNLDKKDDVRKYVIRREIKPKEGKKVQKSKFKAPKIQRLVTPRTLQHKRQMALDKHRRRVATKKLASEYQRLLAQRSRDARRTSSHRTSKKEEEAPKVAAGKDAKPAAKDAKPAAKDAKKQQAKDAKATAPAKQQAKGAAAAPAKQQAKDAKPAAKQQAKDAKPAAAAPAKQQAKDAKPAAAAPAKQQEKSTTKSSQAATKAPAKKK